MIAFEWIWSFLLVRLMLFCLGFYTLAAFGVVLREAIRDEKLWYYAGRRWRKAH